MSDAAAVAIRSAPADVAPVLSIRDAHYAYDRREVLRGVDFEIGAGEIYGLLGPNGAGKTTLVRAISGRIRLEKGAVAVLGHNPRTHGHARAHTGLVPQEIALYARLTGRENLEIFASLAGVPRAGVTRAVAQAMAAVRIEARADQVVSTLSGGWRRRFNVAAGILADPKLLILDEPTVGVDRDARAAIHEAVDRLRRAGMAILLITHDFEQVQSLASRIGVLVNGRIAVQGRPEELLHSHFGGERRAYFKIAGARDGFASPLLTEMGLTLAQADGEWVSERVSDFPSASALAAALESRGVMVTDVALREPTLATLFSKTVADAARALA